MTAFAIEWLWWIFATFGIAGLIAFWFLAPTAAQLTLQFVVRIFRLTLSYRIGCALLAAITAGLIVDQQRHAYDDEQFAKRTAAFEAAQSAKEQRIATETRERVWKEIADATAANAVIDTSVKEWTDALPPTPVATVNPFLVGADADRLCRIAGKTKCGPVAGQRVPEARRAGSGPGDHTKIRLPEIIRAGPRADQQGEQGR